MSTRRSGFTLMEVVVAAVLMAILAGVTTPYLVNFIEKQKAQTAADKLSALAGGVAAFAAAVKTTTLTATASAYPGLISELANVPGVTTVTYRSCGRTVGVAAALQTFNATAVTSWNSNGPFVTFMVTSNGLTTPIGTIADSMARSPTSATVGTLSLVMPLVTTSDATNLDEVVDGLDGASAGTVRWVASASPGFVTVSYLIPVAARC